MKFSRVLSDVVVVSLIFVVGCSGTDEQVVATEFADGGGVTIQPDGPTPAPVSGEERSRAIEIVHQSGLVAEVLGVPRPAFEASEMSVFKAAWFHRVVGFQVQLAEPVDLHGPWWDIECQGSTRFGYRAGWTGVTVLRVAVDLDSREVIGIGVAAPPSEEPLAGEPRGNFDMVRRPLEEDFDGLTVENLVTGESQFIEEPDFSADYCPPGLNDD